MEKTITNFEDMISKYDEIDDEPDSDIKRIKYSEYIDTMYHMQIKPLLEDDNVTEYDLARLEKCYKKMVLIRLKLPIVNSERADKVLQESLDDLLNQESSLDSKPCLESFSVCENKNTDISIWDKIRKWFQKSC